MSYYNLGRSVGGHQIGGVLDWIGTPLGGVRASKELVPIVQEEIIDTLAEGEELLAADEASTMVGQWGSMKRAYATARGETSHSSIRGKTVPILTVGDVFAISDYFNSHLDNDMSDRAREKWEQCLSEIAALSMIANDEIYEDSEHFWYACLLPLVLELDSLGVVPSTFDLIIESLGESVAELPGRVADAAGAAAEAAKKAASSLGLGTILTAAGIGLAALVLIFAMK